MSLVTVVCSMVASACLTLAVVQGLVWWRRRDDLAPVLFALSAVGTALMAGTELWMMRASTPADYGRAVRFYHVGAWLILIPLVAFVRLYLKAGRPWLAWTVGVTRTLSLILNFLVSPNLNYREITGLRRIPFLGEPVSIAVGVPNPWMLVAQVSFLLWVVFVVDAALTVWRRGQRRQAILGGCIVFFTLAGACQIILAFWGIGSGPIFGSPFYLGIILAMSYELSYDMYRSAELGRQLQVSQDRLLLSQHEAQTLSGRLIGAQEDERARLARAMHDGLSQSMALLAVELEMLGQQPPQAAEQITGRMEDFATQVKALSADVHRMAHGLHPAKLDQLGLATAMSGHCRDVERSHAITIRCECRDIPRWLPPEVALCLYRVCQEALRNVVKHSGAKSASVELRAADGELSLSISDDGSGFDLGAVAPGEGLGLLSMRERVRLVLGRIQWWSEPGAGTRVDVRVPLPPVGASG